ncbi:STY0301 family protein [Achromobacter sp.]|uniref:STY0301 family protein n=1 Tax=Achromobacter sp. TaxID=134375 RepID=UPI00391C898F
MYLMMGTRFMSLSERSSRLLTAVGITASAILTSFSPFSVARAASHVYQCPTHLLVDGAQWQLDAINVFDGPIEKLVALVPETSPNDPGLQFWTFNGGATPYMKCLYHGTQHYLVLEAEGATRCTATISDTQVFEASCM